MATGALGQFRTGGVVLNALLLIALWSVILAPFYVEHRRKRGVRRDAASVARWETARDAMAKAEQR